MHTDVTYTILYLGVLPHPLTTPLNPTLTSRMFNFSHTRAISHLYGWGTLLQVHTAHWKTANQRALEKNKVRHLYESDSEMHFLKMPSSIWRWEIAVCGVGSRRWTGRAGQERWGWGISCAECSWRRWRHQTWALSWWLYSACWRGQIFFWRRASPGWPRPKCMCSLCLVLARTCPS